jgi:hypothetical protein
MGKFVRLCQNCGATRVYLELVPQPDTRIVCDPCEVDLKANAESTARLAAEKAAAEKAERAEAARVERAAQVAAQEAAAAAEKAAKPKKAEGKKRRWR